MEKIIKKAEILIEALPYIQKLSGKTIVIKYGGNAMKSEELKNSVMEDITLLKFIGVNPIIVHGGGPAISSALAELGIESKFIDGLRVTDEKTMKVAQQILVGQTNKEIVSLINQKGGKAIGLCGIDGNLIKCKKHYLEKDGKQIDLGFVGDITSIDAKSLLMLAQGDYIPVIAPIGIGEDNKSYNINADTVAGEIASALKAEKLMLLTDIEGVKSKEDEVFHVLSVDEVKTLIDEEVIQGGMIPKVLGCVNALENGVGRTHIIDGTIPHCILLEIFTNKGIGTMITKERIPYYNGEVLGEKKWT